MKGLSMLRCIILATALVATVSNAFLVLPSSVRVYVRPEFEGQRHITAFSKRLSQKPLGLFQKTLDSESTLEKPAGKKKTSLFDFLPIESTQLRPTSPTELPGGRFSMILSEAETYIGPAADVLDELSDGYALTYADLTPESQSTPIGQAFLASNVAYAVAGLALALQGDIFLGLLTELVSAASFIYHFTQLDPEAKNDTVRLALLIDYILAFTSIFVGLGYLLMDGQLPPLEGLVSGGLGITFFLLGCTTCATGTPYVVVHSLWHFFSAYCAFIIGNTHLMGA